MTMEDTQAKIRLLQKRLARIREVSAPDYDAEHVDQEARDSDYDDYLRLRSILDDIHKWTQGVEP